MTSYPCQETIVIHILPNNSKSKLGQLIKYNMRNNFLEKSYTKYGGKYTFKNIPFLKN